MLSRRACIRLVTLTWAATITRRGQADETPQKISQEAAKYQDRPNNMQMCGMCKFYIPPGGKAGSGMMGGQMGPGMMAAGTCELVGGRISPRGWCVLYRPLSG